MLARRSPRIIGPRRSTLWSANTTTARSLAPWSASSASSRCWIIVARRRRRLAPIARLLHGGMVGITPTGRRGPRGRRRKVSRSWRRWRACRSCRARRRPRDGCAEDLGSHGATAAVWPRRGGLRDPPSRCRATAGGSDPAITAAMNQVARTGRTCCVRAGDGSIGHCSRCGPAQRRSPRPCCGCCCVIGSRAARRSAPAWPNAAASTDAEAVRPPGVAARRERRGDHVGAAGARGVGELADPLSVLLTTGTVTSAWCWRSACRRWD